MRKKIFIIHGWDYTPDMHWYPWLKTELEKKGYEVVAPNMPNTSIPMIKEWVNFLGKVVGKIDKNTFFVGHSIGSQTIMRFLEKQPSKNKIGGCVFVAGWFNLTNLEDKEIESIAKPWIETKINTEKVMEVANKIIVLLSENDPFNCLIENVEKFKEINAKVIIEKNKGHYTSDDGINILSSALNAVLKISQ
jgi:predicted alpha/beta hydrolase family esterase